MKIYVSVDMEGLGGVFCWKQVDSDHKEYARELLNKQLEWFLTPLVEGYGEELSVITIADSHGLGSNVSYSVTELDRRIELISGDTRGEYMMPCFSKDYDYVIFFGYHAGIGQQQATMDHTYSSNYHRIKLNGIDLSEALINGAYAGGFGVPIGAIVGDSGLNIQLGETLLGGDYVFVETKESLGRQAAKLPSVKELRERLEDGAKNLLMINREQMPIIRFDKPYLLEMELASTEAADHLCLMPTIERVDGFSVRAEYSDFKVLINAVLAGLHIISGAMRK